MEDGSEIHGTTGVQAGDETTKVEIERSTSQRSDGSSNSSFYLSQSSEEDLGADTEKSKFKYQPVSLYLFHLTCLRLHDNPSLLQAIKAGTMFKGIFVWDPFYFKEKMNSHKKRFLLECLNDLDKSLQRFGTRLYVLQGQPLQVIDDILIKWRVTHVSFEAHVDHGGIIQDESILHLCRMRGVSVSILHSHCLYDADQVDDIMGNTPISSLQQYMEVAKQLKEPRFPMPAPDGFHDNIDKSSCYDIPTLQDLGCPERMQCYSLWYVGGETEALKQLKKYIKVRSGWMNQISSSTQTLEGTPVLLMDHTSLSPHIRFGCLSAKQMAYECRQHSKEFELFVLRKLLIRDAMLHTCRKVKNFEGIKGNPICLSLPWSQDRGLYMKWYNGCTGYPLIDAAMRQLHQEGWIHHYLREAVAAFLTRGDLWLSWELGKSAFEELLVDFEPGVCAGNWIRSSGSGLLDQPIEHYDPVKCGQRVDPNGDYVKMYIPELREYTPQYIFCPWTAPIKLQEKWRCMIGQDYPIPIIDHLTAGSICCEKLKQSIQMYSLSFSSGNQLS